jgi:hypothetical protein
MLCERRAFASENWDAQQPITVIPPLELRIFPQNKLQTFFVR